MCVCASLAVCGQTGCEVASAIDPRAPAVPLSFHVWTLSLVVGLCGRHVGGTIYACVPGKRVCAQGHSRCLRRAATVLYRIVSIIALNAKAMSLFPWGDQVRHFHVPISAPCGSAARSGHVRQTAP